MAKASKPVAGQPGYVPEMQTQSPQLATHTPEVEKPKDIAPAEHELGIRPVAPKVKREITPESIKDARQATGTELLNYLVESGTNGTKLEAARAWMLDNADATCEKLYRYMENAEEHGDKPISLGTLRKAGKWIWGDAWEPETAVFQAPQEEMKRLRERVADQQNDIARKNAEIVMLKNQLAHLEERAKILGSENDHLKVGRTAADFGPGRNVLMGTSPVG